MRCTLERRIQRSRPSGRSGFLTGMLTQQHVPRDLNPEGGLLCPASYGASKIGRGKWVRDRVGTLQTFQGREARCFSAMLFGVNPHRLEFSQEFSFHTPPSALHRCSSDRPAHAMRPRAATSRTIPTFRMWLTGILPLEAVSTSAKMTTLDREHTRGHGRCRDATRGPRVRRVWTVLLSRLRVRLESIVYCACSTGNVFEIDGARSVRCCAVGSWAAGVRVWRLMSRGGGPRTGPPPPEGVHVAYPLDPTGACTTG